MFGKFCFKLFCMTLVFTIVMSDVKSDSMSEVSEVESKGDKTKVLSRRKRFLVFPDGSSFQLVFCAQNQGYLQVGDIIWFGNTAALAWELPSDPMFFYHFKQYEKDLSAQRRQDPSRHIYYLDENGKLLAKVPYHKKAIINPAFAKRSVDFVEPEDSDEKVCVQEMHEKQINTTLFQNMDNASTSFHRESRKSLYVKLEKLFEGLGWQGRECLLQLLCESSKKKNEQGSFVEEIVRAVFTFPKLHVKEEDKYDVAHDASNDCAALYPECKNFQDVFSRINQKM